MRDSRSDCSPPGSRLKYRGQQRLSRTYPPLGPCISDTFSEDTWAMLLETMPGFRSHPTYKTWPATRLEPSGNIPFNVLSGPVGTSFASAIARMLSPGWVV